MARVLMLLLACAFKDAVALKVTWTSQVMDGDQAQWQTDTQSGVAVEDLSKEQLASVECHKGDGFGAQYHCQMAAFVKARHDKQCYVLAKGSFSKAGFHKNSQALKGGDFTGLDSDKDCDNGNNRKIACDTPYCAEGAKKDSIANYYTKEVRDELRAKYWANPKPQVDTSCEVAVHIRAGDAWASRRIPYKVLSAAVDQQFPDKKICIYSEGSKNDFKDFNKLKNVEFKLNAPVDETFHNLVAAPNLVLAKSSFSYTAGVLNKNNVFYVSGFWHKMMPDWQKIPKSSKTFAQELLAEAPPAEPAASDFD